jgi:hypothetical protein
MVSLRVVRPALIATGFAVLLGSRALATTYVVDAAGGPGADFTDLPPAVAAAQPGDVLLVLPGSYSAFTCSEGITIVGYGGPTVTGSVAVTSLPLGRPFVLAGVSPTSLLVTFCDGPVIAQQIATTDEIRVEGSADVRLLDVHEPGTGPIPSRTGLRVSASRVEVVQSSVKGTSNAVCQWLYAGYGLHITDQSRVHFARSFARGGDGATCYDLFSGNGGNGGDGALVVGSQLIAAGAGVGIITGGRQGIAWSGDDCENYGMSGCGLVGQGAEVDYSQVQVLQPGMEVRPNCYFIPEHTCFIGGVFNPVNPGHSTLEFGGTPTPGHSVSLTLRGAVGTLASIWIGRKFILEPEPNADIELAVPRLKRIELGTIPASGSITYYLGIPGNYPPGTVFGVQGECRLESGLLRRSNSVPIVVR